MNQSVQAPGRVKEITSLANPIIKDIRLLEKKRQRDAAGLFIAEGMKLVIDALDLGWSLKTLIHAASQKGQPHVEKLASRAVAGGSDVLVVPEKVLGTIVRRDNPQMVVGIFAQRVTPLSAIKPARDDVWLGLDRIRDPGNLGTIMRTVDAVGAKGVILIGETTDPFATETVRATMGSVFATPVARASEAEFALFAKSWPGLVVGTHLAGSVDYRTPDYADQPVLLVMGNEQQGMPDSLVACCHRLVRIPQAGRADSLNLAVATGICLYEVRRSALSLEAR